MFGCLPAARCVVDLANRQFPPLQVATARLPCDRINRGTGFPAPATAVPWSRSLTRAAEPSERRPFRLLLLLPLLLFLPPLAPRSSQLRPPPSPPPVRPPSHRSKSGREHLRALTAGSHLCPPQLVAAGLPKARDPRNEVAGRARGFRLITPFPPLSINHAVWFPPN